MCLEIPLLLLLLASLSWALTPVFKRRNRPPCPFKLPIIGNLHQMGSLPHRSLARLSAKHGPLMLLQLGHVPTLVVSSSDAVREMVRSQDHIFSDRPSLTVPNRLFYGCRDVAFARYGEYWMKVRKLSVLHLLSPRMVRSYRRIREEEVACMIGKLSGLAPLGPTDLSEVLMSLAKDVIGRMAFGVRLREEGWDDEINALVEESNALLASFHLGDHLPWLAWVHTVTGFDARVERTRRKLDTTLDRIIDRVRVGIDGKSRGASFIDILLSLQEGSLGMDSIKALIQDMYGAGADSTIIVLEWAMAELVRNPEAMRKLQDEVGRQANPRTAVIREADLVETGYLRAVIKETMRLHPPGPLLIPRQLMESTRVQGYEIPRHARVIVNAWAIGRDPRRWDAPDEFRPERFLGRPTDFRGQDFELVPFGLGRRMCPGIQFAMSIVELALANLVHRFDWELPGGMKVEDLDMEEGPGITNRMRTRLFCVAKSRRS